MLHRRQREALGPVHFLTHRRPHPLLLLKLALIPAAILAATLAARRYGHGVAGVLAGLPIIAGPIVAVLLMDHPPEQIVRLAIATLRSLPASVAFIILFARLAPRQPWWLCLGVSAAAFWATGWVATGLELESPWLELIALIGPALVLSNLPPMPIGSHGVPIPHAELVLRLVVALLVGALIIYGADRFSPRVNGLLLAWPIAGSLLPSFTLSLHGPTAALALLRGFAYGMGGFAGFFVTLKWTLELGLGSAASFMLALAMAALVALLIYRARQRAQPVARP